jgi:CHAD domain-containing protein
LLPEIAIPDLGTDATAGAVVQRAIALSVIRLILHDPVVRIDVDPEGVHQTRVATRRLRSDLRTFRPLLDRDWAQALRDELGWIARILGDVRDGDVLLERLRRRADELSPDERAAVERVLTTLQESRDAAHAGLLETLGSDRYVALLDRLVAAASAPGFLASADEPARDAVPTLVRRPWHSLAKRAKALGDEPSNEQLHEIRIRAKRVRYAAEAASPIVGKPARAFANAASSLQDVLGDLNDSVVAARWLEDWAVRADDAKAALGATSLAALERSAALEQRGLWRAVLDELSEPELRAWM